MEVSKFRLEIKRLSQLPAMFSELPLSVPFPSVSFLGLSPLGSTGKRKSKLTARSF